MEIIVKSKYGDKVVLIDKRYYDLLPNKNIGLTFSKRRNNFYANCRINGKVVGLHRFIMGFPVNTEIDHKDRDGLNNLKENLRTATQSQNSANKPKTKRSKSKYKGVYKHSQCDKFRVQFMCNREIINGGYFINEDEAALKYNELALAHFGEFAFLNEVGLVSKKERIGKLRVSNTTGYRGVYLDKKNK